MIIIFIVVVFFFIEPKDAREEKYQNAINSIKCENGLDQASMGLCSLWLDNNYKDSKVLYMYASALSKDTSYGSYYFMKSIPVDYNGDLADDIKKFREKVDTEENRQKETAGLKEAKETKYVNNYNYSAFSKPSIGSTANDVKNTTWGNPEKVNRTTTANGVSEQWVYGSGRYVYIENGIVTAVQD